MEATLEQLANWLDHPTILSPRMSKLIVCGIAIDTRTIVAGNVFIALCGERFDAHNFLATAEIRGAVAVIVERIPLINLHIPVFLVPNTRIALRQIASHWRKKFSIPLIAITGSNGKTTVKKMISDILSVAFGKHDYLVTNDNFNNEIGVSLTLCRLKPQHRIAVLELGMNHPGEIAILGNITQPTLALVNNAQREHQEFMLTVEAVARENGAIFSVLPFDGIAIFPIEDQYAWIWRDQLTQCQVLNFGLNVDTDISATYVRTQFGSRIVVTVRIDNKMQKFQINLAVVGQHNVYNALAAIACTLAVGINITNIIRGLETFTPVHGRLQYKIASNGATIIDDTYNANPDSVRVAIDVLSQSSEISPRRRRILVLGDMGEIGHNQQKYHQEIGDYAHQCGIEYFFGFGSAMRYAVEAFNTASLACHYTIKLIARHFHTIEALNLAVKQIASAQTLVLVKGSRFMKMERVVQYLVGASFTG